MYVYKIHLQNSVRLYMRFQNFEKVVVVVVVVVVLFSHLQKATLIGTICLLFMFTALICTNVCTCEFINENV